MSNDDEVKALLSELRKLARKIASNDDLMSRRRELYRRLRDLNVPRETIAEAAQTTEQAITMALNRRRRASERAG